MEILVDPRFTRRALPFPCREPHSAHRTEALMATTLADFAEQANPKTLSEARRAGFKQATRVHGSFLATAEKRALVWMAERMPAWISSDLLTVLGFVAQIATGVCYTLAGHDRRMLLAAIV